MRELAKQFDGFQIISACCFFCGGESTDVYNGVLKSYARSPWSLPCDLYTKCYAFVFSSLLCLFMVSAISEILTHCTWTKVLVTIVQSIAVNVVNVWTVAADYLSVHTSGGFSSLINRIPPLAALIKVSLPPSVGQPTVTMFGYDRALIECEPNISTRSTVNVHGFLGDFGVLRVPSTFSTKLRPLRFRGSTVGTIIVLVWALLCWCKISQWLGTSFLRRHNLSATEVVWSGHTQSLYQELRAA